MQRNIFLSCHIVVIVLLLYGRTMNRISNRRPSPQCRRMFAFFCCCRRCHPTSLSCVYTALYAVHFCHVVEVKVLNNSEFESRMKRSFSVIWVTFNFMFAWTKGWKNQTWSCLLLFKINTLLVLVKKNTWVSGSLRAFFFGEEKKKIAY